MTNTATRHNTEAEFLLIQDCLKKNNSQAQERLYKHYYGYAMAISMRYTKSREEAAEILNDSFLKVFQKLELYDGKSLFRAWLNKIVLNTAIDNFRRTKIYKENREDFKLAQFHETTDFSVFDHLSADEILALLQRLPDHYRIVFNLYEIEGLTHEEISKQLNIPLGTSKSSLSRAKLKLRELLQELYEVKPDEKF